MREWIEILPNPQTQKERKQVLPRMREWIEIITGSLKVDTKFSSPSYEGVD